MNGLGSTRRQIDGMRRRATDSRPTPHTVRPGAFSLIELMLAMTILGLGLVLVATMFPVAWTRARELAEFTTQENITKSAEVIMRQIARTGDAQGGLTINRTTFAGDVIYYPPSAFNTMFFIEANPRVHALYMENLTVGADRRFVPDRSDASADEIFAPWRQERVDRPNLQLAVDGVPPMFYSRAFGDAQISFEQRLYPALPRRALDTVDKTGRFTDTDETWENTLDERRYAWAILHRLRRDPITVEAWNEFNADANNYQVLAGEPREFDIYYVTLRRSRPTLRYAVQDSTAVPDPFALDDGSTPRRGLPVTPVALPPEDDVVLPVPWRVQVWFPSDVPPEAEATGVPTEIEVNTDDASTDAPFLVNMFDVGTPFVDEANGKVYHVARRRIVGANADQALLTLDQEVTLEDIDDGFSSRTVANEFGNGILDESEQRRTVWVFPPPVEPDRTAAAEPVFNGRQPVVGIDVRPLTVFP